MSGSATEPMSRRERERERHRCEILEAAERIFAQNGYNATTVEAIAKEAEFAVGTLYKFFKGKDDIYSHVMGALCQRFVEDCEKSVLSIDDPEEAIAALIALRLAHSDEHRDFLRVLFETNPASRVDPVQFFPPSAVGMYDRYIEGMRGLFQRGMERGVFDASDPLYAALCLEGIITAFVAYWAKHEPTEPLAVRTEKIQHEFLGRIKIRLGGEPKRQQRQAN